MFKKIKDWLGANLDVYKVEKADDVGAGLVRHKWQGEQTATQTGTTLTADILNNFQKGLIPFVETVRTTGTDKDIYTVSVNGLKEFGLFDGLKLLLQIDNENQYNNSVININDSEYPLYSVKNGANEAVKKGSLRTKGYYFITYNQNTFYLNAGNVLGTEADTALEGKRLAEIIGLEFGGNIQDTGAKVTGKFYYDKALKYYYECIANNNLTYNDGSKFRAISNKPLSDKVENLSKIETKIIDKGIALLKSRNIVILTWDSNYYLQGSLPRGTVLATLPAGYRPILDISAPVTFWNSNNSGTIKIRSNGQITWESSINLQGTIYVNASYLVS